MAKNREVNNLTPQKEFRKLSLGIQAIVKRHKINEKIIEEAIQWARMVGNGIYPLPSLKNKFLRSGINFLTSLKTTK